MQKKFWRQCYWQCCQPKVYNIAKTRWFGPMYIPAYNIHIYPWIKNKNYTTVSLKRDQNWTLTVNKSIVYFCISCISDTNAFIPAGLGDGETPTFWIRFEKKYYSFHPDQQFWFIQLDLALAFRSYPVDEVTICAIRPCTCFQKLPSRWRDHLCN